MINIYSFCHKSKEEMTTALDILGIDFDQFANKMFQRSDECNRLIGMASELKKNENHKERANNAIGNLEFERDACLMIVQKLGYKPIKVIRPMTKSEIRRLYQEKNYVPALPNR